MTARKGFLIAVSSANGESRIFDSATLRDAFWSENKLHLTANDSYCFTTINGVLTLQQWAGATSPDVYDGENWVLGLRRVQKERGQSRRTGGVDTDLSVAGTRYKIIGVFEASPVNNNWTVSSDGISTYIGDGDAFDLDGVSDLESSKVGRVTFVLYENGIELPGSHSPHDFSTAHSSETLSMTSSLRVDTGNYYEVYAFGSVDNMILTPNTLTTKFVN